MDTEEIIKLRGKTREIEIRIEAIKNLLVREGIIIAEDLDREFNELMDEVDKNL